MTSKKRYETAINEISNRRQQAVIEAGQRRNEVIKKIPEIQTLENALSATTINLTKLVLQKAENINDIIPKIMAENLEIQDKIKSLLTENGFSEDYLDIKYTCPKCNDTGILENGYCDCLKELVKKLNIDDFNKNNYMSLCSFDDFSLEYYTNLKGENGKETPLEIMTKVYRFCVGYAQRFSENSPSILMMGNTGLGKTHLSFAIAKSAMEKGYSVLYGSAQDFFGKVQREYFGRSDSDTDTMATILDADLLIIDDLGAEYESAFNTSTFYTIVNSRLNEGKPTIINTNLTPYEIEARYTARVASRLLTLYKILKFSGTDIRALKLKSLDNI